MAETTSISRNTRNEFEPPMPTKEVAETIQISSKEDLVKKMHLKEIDQIMIEINTIDSENRRHRKILYLNTRNLNLDEQAQVIAGKIQTYLEKKRIFLDSVGVFFQAVSAAAGGQTTIWGGLFHVVAQAFDKTAQNKGQISQAERDVFDYRYKILDSSISEEMHQSKQADQEFDRAMRSTETLLQTIHRLFELMLSSGG